MPGSGLDSFDVEGVIDAAYRAVGQLAECLSGSEFSDALQSVAKPENVEQFVESFVPQITGIFGSFSDVLGGLTKGAPLEGISRDVMPDSIMRALSSFGGSMDGLTSLGDGLDLGALSGTAMSAIDGARKLGGKGLEVFSGLYSVVEPLQKVVEKNLVQAAVKEGLPMVGEAIDEALASQGIPTGGMARQISTMASPLVENLAAKGIDVGHEVGKSALGSVSESMQSERAPLSGSSEAPNVIDEIMSYGGLDADALSNPGAQLAKPVVMSQGGHGAADTSMDLNALAKHMNEGLADGLKGTELGDVAAKVASSITEHTTPEELSGHQEIMNKALAKHNGQFTQEVDEKFGPTNPAGGEHQLDLFKGLQPAEGLEVPTIGQVVSAFQSYVEHHQAFMKKIESADDVPEKLKLAALSTIYLSAQALEDERRLASPILQVAAPICTAAGIQIGMPALTAALCGSDAGTLTMLSPILAATGGAASKVLVSASSNMSHVALEKVKVVTGDKLGVDEIDAASKAKSSGPDKDEPDSTDHDHKNTLR